jgi:DNA-binding transcriptional LysR family regulator
MHRDLNLLVTLNVLLQEGSVARAAKRLQLSPSAMSRALARLRETMGDPLLVRAGRGLVATPRALELREQVSHLVEATEAVLRPVGKLDVKNVVRNFTLRTSEGFVENFGPQLLAVAKKEAPGVTLRFLQKIDRDALGLRDGSIDLETGVIALTTSPEIRTQALFRDRVVGVVRKGHALANGRVTPARYATAEHILVSRPGMAQEPIDEALSSLGVERNVSVVVGGFVTAIALARVSNMVASVPELHTRASRAGMVSFPLPYPTKEFLVSMMWHPRLDADLAHRWLRDCVRTVCASPGDRTNSGIPPTKGRS